MRNWILFAALLLQFFPGCDDPKSGEWGACTSNKQCKGGLICDNGVCVVNAGSTPCFVDGQCALDEKCINKVCTPGNLPPECSTDVPCPDGQECLAGSCHSSADSDVTGTPDNINNDNLEPECSKDEDCGEGHHCAEGSCQPSSEPQECSDDEDCTEGTCDTELGICVVVEPECAADEDCDSGVCDTGAGECIDNPADCTESVECDDQDSCTEDACVNGKCKNIHVANETCCLVDNDCPPALAPCTSAKCVDFACIENSIADCCTGDPDCDDGNPITLDACINSLCVNEAKACVYDADCNDANPCTIDTCKQQKCVNVQSADPLCCLTDENCNDENPDTLDTCIDNVCTFKNVTACEGDADCIDSNPCTTEACKTGSCIFKPIQEPQCHCENDTDCIGKGETCVLAEVGLMSLDTYCSNPTGPRVAGESCTDDSQCKSGYCVQFDDGDICFGPCKNDLDCNDGTICASVTFNATVTIAACVIPPSFCKGDKDCPDNEVCLPGQNPDNPNTILGVCGPTQGPKTAGQLCAVDDDCESGHCFNLTEKGIHVCWAACQTDDDCLPGLYCYENLSFFKFDQDTPDNTADDKYYAIPICTPYLGTFNACLADSDCPGNEFCSTYTNKTMTALEPKCISSVGNSPAGSICSNDADCKSNWCNDALPDFCVGLCKNDSDCNAGATCEVIDFTLNEKGDEAPAHLCLQ